MFSAIIDLAAIDCYYCFYPLLVYALQFSSETCCENTIGCSLYSYTVSAGTVWIRLWKNQGPVYKNTLLVTVKLQNGGGARLKGLSVNALTI